MYEQDPGNTEYIDTENIHTKHTTPYFKNIYGRRNHQREIKQKTYSKIRKASPDSKNK